MPDWKPGDHAVCIDDGPIRTIGGWPEVRPEEAFAIQNLRRGRVYRISRLIPVMMGGFTAIICGDERVGGCTDRFRKIEPAETIFTEAMRNLKPRVEA